MKPHRVYVAAPYEDAARVVEIHERLRSFGMTATSSWAEHSTGGPEKLEAFTVDTRRAFAEQNDRDLRGSSAMIVLARPAVGGEMFAEARLAILLDIPVFWLGRRILSTYRNGVRIVEDLDEAIEILRGGQCL